MAVRIPLFLTIGGDISELAATDSVAASLPIAGTYGDLPASISGAQLFVVTSDSNNENKTSIYVLVGTKKIWLASEEV